MRNLTLGLLIFMAGWGVSWYTYHQLDQDLPYSAQPPTNTHSAPVVAERPKTEVTPKASPHVDNIANLLRLHNFESAVESYESLQLQSNAEAATNARTNILLHARELVAQYRFSLAEKLLQRFLVATFRDVEARLLLAEVYLGEHDFNAAIDQLYEVRGYAYRPLMLQKITSRIRSTVAKRAFELKGNNDLSALLALYQHLTQQEPDHAPWFIGLAAAQLALDDNEAARSSLMLVSQDPDVGAQALLMLSELTVAMAESPDTAPQGSVSEVAGIPLSRSGHHFIVDANPSGNRDIRLLIDTGASLTMLSPEVFQQPGIEYENTGRAGVFNTANGPVRAPVYILDSLTIGGWQVNRLKVGVLAMPGHEGIDGLLGMNFLKHFQFFIDQNEDQLRLSGQ